MKYIYFISYFETTNTNGFGFGNCKVTLDGEIDYPNDIEYIEKELSKGDKEIEKVTIINFQLIKAIKKEVE